VAMAIRRDFGFVPIFDHFAIFGRCREYHRAEPCSEPGLERRGPSEERVDGGR
jgi:hypothetical protein